MSRLDIMPTGEPAQRSGGHRFSQRHFDGIASGGGDAAAVTELLAVERSWRLLQFRAVLDAAEAQPDAVGPLPPVGVAWRLLVRAERAAPARVGRLLLHPQAGTWAGYVLRRLRRSTVDSSPLWVDLGYLHAIAAAAATLAGIDFTITVPARDGFAVLPTLGCAHLPESDPWGTAVVRGAQGSVTVAGESRVVEVGGVAGGSAGWIRLPAVRSEATGRTLSINLDFVDPYRNLRTPAPPQRLSASECERWHRLLVEAWRLVNDTCPEFAEPMASGLFSVVPQPAAERFRTMSASAGDAFGSMIMSEPRDATELAVTLVHEFQHIKLGGLLHVAPMHDGEPADPLYAPWRDDPRPLSGLLQGVYAFIGITEFWRALRTAAAGTTGQLAQFEFARWRRQVWTTLQTIQGLPQLTGLGRRLVSGLAGRAARWQDEPVPADPLTAAEAAVADHRARWRLHHLRPAEAVVDQLAAAWRAGAQQPPDLRCPEPAVVADPGASRLDSAAVLTLWRLSDPTGFADLLAEPARVDAKVRGATPAGLAFASGERERARSLYCAELAAEPEAPGAWAGLGLTGAVDSPATESLRRRPELVSAVYRAVRDSGGAADPVALAGWLGGRPALLR